MKRRDFIKKTGIATTIGLAIPSFIACKEDEINYTGNVAIIGAGAAGLHTAYLLNKKKIKIDIFEASNRYGGRIKHNIGFSDFPIELGAEEVHGQRSVYFDMLSQNGAKLKEDNESESYYYIDGQLKSETQLDNNVDMNAAWNLEEDMPYFTGTDISVQQWISNNEISANTQPYLNAVLGNENGTSSNRIGMSGIAEADYNWTSGNRNFLLQGQAILPILEKKFKDILGFIKLNTPIKQIDTSGTQIKITDKNDIEYLYDKVFLTIPLTQYQKSKIEFTPALSAEKMEGFSNLAMDAGMKIILKFNTRFWNANMGSLYGTGYIPEWWATGYGRSISNNVLTSFVMGEKAEYLSQQGDNATNIILAELNQIFGNNLATLNFNSAIIQDWSKVPYIEGAYSYQKVGGKGARTKIIKPIDNKLFFGGEAFNTSGHFATVHGAMESAERMVNEFVTTL